MELKDVRDQIDKIDSEIANFFENRMDIVNDVTEYKKQNNLPVLNAGREREILARVVNSVKEDYKTYTRVLFNTLFSISRSHQKQQIIKSDLEEEILSAVKNTPEELKTNDTVACQGVEGAYSEIACDKLFNMANILYFRTFDGVFSAVEKGLCKYGILPIENSSYGSVNEVYDLMKVHHFHIVKRLKIHVSHVLLAKEGVDFNDIKEVYSHEQAIGQCSEFFKNHPNIKISVCENTAIAAKMVAESDRKDVAAISSSNCIELYGLKAIDKKVQNNENNYTRFICICKDLEIYPGANKISIMLNLSHKPGALYNVMSKFNALEINLSKLESRPMVGSDFEFMFYFDIDASVKNQAVLKLLSELNAEVEKFVFLGAYSEI